MDNLTERQRSQATDLKESIVLDSEFQNYIDICDKILSKNEKDYQDEVKLGSENTIGMKVPDTAGMKVPGTIATHVPGSETTTKTKTPGVTASQTPGSGVGVGTQVNQVQNSHIQNQAQQLNTSMVNTLRQMKIKMKNGQDITNDLTSLFNIVK